MKLVEKVEDFLHEKAKEIAAEFYEWMVEELKMYATEYEHPMLSPVEQLFFIEWYSLHYRSHTKRENRYYLIPQFQDESTGKHRLDFRVSLVDYVINTDLQYRFSEKTLMKIPEPKLGIEIDSHQWHEKTKEQVQRDKERERFLIKNGWKLLRFTGSEVYKNPKKCLDELDSIATDMASDWYKELERSQETKGK